MLAVCDVTDGTGLAEGSWHAERVRERHFLLAMMKQVLWMTRRPGRRWGSLAAPYALWGTFIRNFWWRGVSGMMGV